VNAVLTGAVTPDTVAKRPFSWGPCPRSCFSCSLDCAEALAAC
jgi:hypothetical protein